MTCETEKLVAAAIQDAQEMLSPLDGLIEKAAMDAARNRGWARGHS